MDPYVTWLGLKAAMRDGDGALIRDKAIDLLSWLERGGFVPLALTTEFDRETFVGMLRLIRFAAAELEADSFRED